MKLPNELQKQPPPERRPLHPYLVLGLAVILPGAGHVAQGMPQRGLVFVFFILLLGWVTFHLTSPEQSFVGRYSGGFFVYAISVMDAYRWARLRWEQFRAGPAP